jgi:lipopolysaccharide/colanic/teichoic acid biosynthesis glycosyltransferase
MLLTAETAKSTASGHDPAMLGTAGSREGAGNQITDSVRRYLNVVCALVAFIVALPLMAIVALLVRLTSPGPVLYRQPRVGLDRRGDIPISEEIASRRQIDHGGRLFWIYKFRTMHVAPPDAAQRWATRDDPRVTPIGRYLRRYRLDELPQLWNVLRGDMNLVGPRPEQPGIFAQLRGQIPHYDKRQRVLPGITGLAQISQPYDRCLDDVKRKVDFDLEYIGKVSPLQDLKILLGTLPAVVFRRGGW